jgi:hypothetical protein
MAENIFHLALYVVVGIGLGAGLPGVTVIKRFGGVDSAKRAGMKSNT